MSSIQSCIMTSTDVWRKHQRKQQGHPSLTHVSVTVMSTKSSPHLWIDSSMLFVAGLPFFLLSFTRTTHIIIWVSFPCSLYPCLTHFSNVYHVESLNIMVGPSSCRLSDALRSLVLIQFRCLRAFMWSNECTESVLYRSFKRTHTDRHISISSAHVPPHLYTHAPSHSHPVSEGLEGSLSCFGAQPGPQVFYFSFTIMATVLSPETGLSHSVR